MPVQPRSSGVQSRVGIEPLASKRSSSSSPRLKSSRFTSWSPVSSKRLLAGLPEVRVKLEQQGARARLAHAARGDSGGADAAQVDGGVGRGDAEALRAQHELQAALGQRGLAEGADGEVDALVDAALDGDGEAADEVSALRLADLLGLGLEEEQVVTAGGEQRARTEQGEETGAHGGGAREARRSR